MGDKTRLGRTFIFKDGYFEVSLPTGYYGASQKWMYMQTYPDKKTASAKALHQNQSHLALLTFSS